MTTRRRWQVGAGVWAFLCWIPMHQTIMGFDVDSHDTAYALGAGAELALWGTMALIGVIACLWAAMYAEPTKAK